MRLQDPELRPLPHLESRIVARPAHDGVERVGATSAGAMRESLMHAFYSRERDR